MKVQVLEEHGYESALLGMSLSYYRGDQPIDEWWTWEKFHRAERVASKLAGRDGGHNKFLESIQVWLLVQASRGWWAQFDTYRVGMTKQSQSTMHTLAKRPPEDDDFDSNISLHMVRTFQEEWNAYRQNINRLKAALPEGYLQWRQICTNYKALRHIVHQRHSHRLGEWAEFIEQLRNELRHPQFLE